VNDQTFEPFVIFPETAQPLVTTSHRADPEDRAWSTFSLSNLFSGVSENREQNGKKTPVWKITVNEAITFTGTIVSICGFVVQFISLRGIHWSASVAQLGTTVIITILKAAVRRNLAKNLKALPLVPGHKLD